MRVLLLLLGAAVLLASSVSEAKIGGKGLSSKDEEEANTWLLEKELEDDLKDLEELEEGSGDYDDDDDEDYDDEDYDEDDDLEGSGGDFSTSSFEDTFIDDLDTKKNSNKQQKKVVLPETSSSDIHFEEDDDLLSEYYEEEYEPDYYDDEDVYIKKNSKEIMEEENVVVMVTPKEETAAPGVLDAFLRSLRPSYVYITLASALLSFVIALTAFFLCRRSSLARRQEKKLVPFVVGDARLQFNPAAANNGGSIVKSYQRVPTSTREFLSGSQVHGSRVVEMGAAEKKGLLA